MNRGSGRLTEMVHSVVPSGLEAFSAVNSAAAGAISSTGSADSTEMLSAVAAAIGPIGAS
jgi:hypothetical protein